MTARTIDLTVDNAIVHRLLSSKDWRDRVVEEASVSSALWCTRKRSLQVGFLLAELEELLPAGWTHEDFVVINLPIGSLPKGPVTGFNVTAPGDNPAYLLPRRDIADIQLDLVMRLVDAAELKISVNLVEALRAALAFDASVLLRYLPRSEQDPDYEHRRDYLLDLVPDLVDKQLIDEWRRVAAGVGSVLLARAAEEPRADSPIDDLLLVVPQLVHEGYLHGVADVERLLADWWALVDKAVRVSRRADHAGAAANDLLLVLADYGRRWDVVARCTVPLNAPFTAHLEWRRGLKVGGGWHRYASQWIVFSDAKSNHFRLDSADVSVTLGDVYVEDLDGQQTLDTAPARKRSNREYFALYGSDPNRDYLVNIVFELRLPIATQALLMALSAFLLCCIALLVGNSPSQPAQIAALIAPGTIAASIVLAREQTTLAAMLRRRLNSLLVVLLAVLWLVASILLAHADWALRPTSSG